MIDIIDLYTPSREELVKIEKNLHNVPSLGKRVMVIMEDFGSCEITIRELFRHMRCNDNILKKRYLKYRLIEALYEYLSTITVVERISFRDFMEKLGYTDRAYELYKICVVFNPETGNVALLV